MMIITPNILTLFSFLSKFFSSNNDYNNETTSPADTTLGKFAVGIDLGTTFSCIFIFDPSTGLTTNLKIHNNRTLPSILTYVVSSQEDVNGNKLYDFMPLVGTKAVSYNRKNPDKSTLLYAFKRLIGLPAINLQTDSNLKDINKKVEYKVKAVHSKDTKDGAIKMEFLYDNKCIKEVDPVEASSEILKEMYEEILRYVSTFLPDDEENENDNNDKQGDNSVASDTRSLSGSRRRRAMDSIASLVITLPAYFNENQVAATWDAAKMAGIPVTRTLNEPVAAAYAYQTKHPEESESTKLVFDMGGGTLDISLLEYDEGVMEVKTYAGDNFLGGENVNENLFNHFLALILTQFNQFDGILEKYRNNIKSPERLRLRSFVEDFKIELCTKQNKYPKENAKITKTFFVTEDEKIDITLDTKRFNEICQPIWNKINHYLLNDIDGILGKEKFKGRSKSDIQKVLFVGGSSRIPKIREILGNLFGQNKLCFDLDADMCVSEGASLYAAGLAGFISEEMSLHLVDVVSMPVGICVDRDQFVSILEANATVPAEGSKIFTTSSDNQSHVKIQVAQGLRYAFKDNHHLGSFDLHLEKQQPRGVPQIRVSVKMDKDRSLHVTAHDEATGKEEKIVFNRDIHTLTDEQIKRMKNDSEKNIEKDNKLRERYEAILKLEGFIQKGDGILKNIGNEVDQGKKDNLKNCIERIEEWILKNKESGSMEDIENRINEINEAINEVTGEEGQKVFRDREEMDREKMETEFNRTDL